MKLKFYILALFFTGFSFIIKAQIFEGKLVYIESFVPKNIYSKIYNDTVTIFVKGNMLKTYHTGIPNSFTNYYLNKNLYMANHLYRITIKDTSSTSLNKIYEDQNNMLKESRYKKRINKLSCKRYDYVEKNNGTENSYSSIWITDKWRTLFLFMPYLYKDKGIMVKKTLSYSQVSIYFELIKIQPMELDSSIFELPDYPIEEKDMSKISQQYIKQVKQK